MKKLICLFVALVLCVSFACVASADNDFVPSISYKDAPDVDSAVVGDKDISASLIITSVIGAQDKTTDIPQATRDQLVKLYEELSNGSMTLPVDGDYVIRDLLDVSLVGGEQLGENATATVIFDLGVGVHEKVVFLQYKNNEWHVVTAVNNGDGTVTVVLDSLGPVAFVTVEDSSQQTGDAVGQSMGLWLGLLAVSACAVAVTVANRRKFFN